MNSCCKTRLAISLRAGRAFTLLLLAAVVVLSYGCGPRGDDTLSPGSNTTGTPNANANWPFWPVSMNVHPLTRWTVEEKTQRLLLEARIEFLDAQGNRTKAVGRLDLLLVDAPASGDAAATEVAWSQDLYDPAMNQQHFDIVTRTYLLKLDVQRNQVPAQPELRVTFATANNLVMQAALKVKPPTN